MSISIVAHDVLMPVSRKRESASHLVYQMCEGNAAQTLMTYNFSGFADEVEDCLAFKVRNADPRARPNYSRILYGWYTNRGDHKNGARVLVFGPQTILLIVARSGTNDVPTGSEAASSNQLHV